MTTLMFINCGGGSTPDQNSSTDGATIGTTDTSDEFSQSEYKGLVFYYKNIDPSQYKLKQLTDAKFNELDKTTQLQVAHTLLNTLFFGYPLNTLKEKIDNGDFLSAVREGLQKELTDKAWLEEYILDDAVFTQYDSSWYEPQAITILTRFYAMKKLDKYFLQNWIAYILTQTIMFSPAYELSSTHTPNISGVYNRLVTMLENESGMRFITYVHMMSEDNWRRFRSPEDNGREMLEIYLMDTDDTHVPLAGQALKNWKLNTDSDTLEVSLNRNTEALRLFGTTVYTGEDFYRELAKSSSFAPGVTRRLVDFFFPEKSETEKTSITDSIVASSPETWQDILLQILFSETYLLHNNRAQSAEETFYSLAKKIDFRHRRNTFYYLKENLEKMHQATMKYKLGKIERVPLDTLSFANYHKYIRESILLNKADSEQTDPDSWSYDGWQESFISFEHFDANSSDDTKSLESFVDYLFEATIGRRADSAEQALFRNHMIESRDGKMLFKYTFNMFATYDDPQKEIEEQEKRKENIATIILDYISRLERTYRQREVN
jgi:hypothetical protein